MKLLASVLMLTFVYSTKICTCKEEFLDLNEAPLTENKPDLQSLSDSFSKFITEFPLKNRYEQNNFRFKGFKEATRLLARRNAKILVELGTIRKNEMACRDDGCSTLVLGYFAQLLQIKLYSVDIDENSCVEAKRIGELAQNVEIVNSDSIEFLKNFNGRFIDFLYMDTMEFDVDNVSAAQEHYLKEIKEAYRKLHKNSVVMIDDCGNDGYGNCNLVREFLVNEGWKIYKQGFQEIYIFNQE